MVKTYIVDNLTNFDTILIDSCNMLNFRQSLCVTSCLLSLFYLFRLFVFVSVLLWFWKAVQASVVDNLKYHNNVAYASAMERLWLVPLH